MSRVRRRRFPVVGVNESATLLLVEILLIVKLLLRRFVVVVASGLLVRFTLDVVLVLMMILADVGGSVVESANVGDHSIALGFDGMRQHDFPLGFAA